MDYQQITIPLTDPALREILIARLSACGYEGFEEQEEALQAFIPGSDFEAGELERVLSDLKLSDSGLSWSATLLEARNWNEEWEKSFEPVIVNDFCAIRAAFHPPMPQVAHELVITPKMSFGTGHHATTCLMIQAMQYLDFKDRRVLDFGTGTGVLAILAERLGAREVIAVDIDDWSIENARENIAENHCQAIRLEKMDAVPAIGPFDILLANINKPVILIELPAIKQQIAPQGVILLSGLLQDDQAEIEREAFTHDLLISDRMTKGNWICLKAGKKKQITS
jgi:ribosomal protein L11 methyltransferase